jgi:endonuclease YncB( thermonuclease family)
MSFEEFQTKARLYVVGALDREDIEAFEEARGEYGERAEEFIRECSRLNSAFALSLRPRAPKPETRDRLLARIRNAMKTNGHGQEAREM